MTFTVPNILTIFRLVAAPIVGGFLVFQSNTFAAVMALVIFVIACITDYLDGYLARHLNQLTSLGRLLDPIADKAMVVIALCCINYQLHGDLYKVLIGIPDIVILFREVFVAGLREFLGDKSSILRVTKLSKWKTASQMIAIGSLLSSNVSALSFLPFSSVGLVILWISALITFLTGWDYFIKALPEFERG